MAKPGKTYSESWHRIANLRVSLRPTVRMRKQFFRGRQWYVLHDPFNNSFFRIHPEARDFLVHLTMDRSVAEAWDLCLRKYPDMAPGQEDVIRLLTNLYYANLLYAQTPTDADMLFQRYQKRRKREFRSRLMSFMFMRMPLIDPDRWLNQARGLIQWMVSRFGAVIGLGVILFGMKVALDHFSELTQQSQGVLAPDNLLLLYGALVVVKSLHELGHAAVCKRFGGQVHTMGVMLLVFTPLPYMDATASWMFQSRWQRALVGAAGMMVEMFLAAVAAIVWAHTGPGTLHALAYNIMFIASVSTLLFNINPLLRFDGYYILSDLLDVPNLHTRSKNQLRHLAEFYLFGCRDSVSPAETVREATFLAAFGLASGLYRMVVFLTIILFVSNKFLLVGMILALFCIIAWVVVPPIRLFKYLFTGPSLAKNRARAINVSLGTAMILVVMIGFCPIPHRFRVPGVLESEIHQQVVSEVPGFMAEILTDPGARVEVGAPLVRLRNREIDLDIAEAKAQWEEVLVMEQRARRERLGDLTPIQMRKQTLAQHLEDLKTHQESLTLVASQPGLWVSPRIQESIGAFVSRGTTVGWLVGTDEFRFTAVVSQEDASRLFQERSPRSQVRLTGKEGIDIPVSGVKVIPFQQDQLPSAALGWLGGGQVAVTMGDETGLETTEPFFQIHASVERVPRVDFRHGQSGKLRFSLDPEPLFAQAYRKVQQVIQKRVQL